MELACKKDGLSAEECVILHQRLTEIHFDLDKVRQKETDQATAAKQHLRQA